MTPKLVSYTLPCHKREADLLTTLPSVIAAANAAPPVEIVVVDYGHPGTLVKAIWGLLPSCAEGVSLRTIRVEAEHFHMARARNVGIQRAQGQIIVAFLADQFVGLDFFKELRAALQPGTFLKWIETFAFWRDDIRAVCGFDERCEFYGPEGKELADRLQRHGVHVVKFPASCGIDQIKTPDSKKLQHYRLPLSKQEMHARGMDVWQENRINEVTVANQGKEWGQIA